MMSVSFADGALLHPEARMRRLLMLMAALLPAGCALQPGYADPDRQEAAAEGRTVTICHRDEKSLDVLPAEASEHLGHGDSYGPCAGDQADPQDP